MPGALVQAYQGGTGAVCCTFVGGGSSDSSGNYFRSRCRQAPTRSGSTRRPRFTQQWTGGPGLRQRDIPITVAGTALVNITLAGNVIRGTVKDAGGFWLPAHRSRRTKVVFRAVCCTFVGGGSSDSSGNYAFAVPAGTYKIWINPPTPFPQQWNGGPDFASATPITVSGTALVNITLAGNVIRGTVKDAGGLPVAGASVQAYQGGTGAVCCTFVGGGSSDSSGNYAFAVPAGTYKIWINPPTPFPQQWNGGPDFASATPITVSGTALVNITLAGNVIRGTVKDAGGLPVAGASVQAYQGGTGAVCCTFVGGGSSDSSGNYAFAVPAGTYKIWINPPTPFPQQWNGGPDFAGATPITVSGTALVNITLHP